MFKIYSELTQRLLPLEKLKILKRLNGVFKISFCSMIERNILKLGVRYFRISFLQMAAAHSAFSVQRSVRSFSSRFSLLCDVYSLLLSGVWKHASSVLSFSRRTSSTCASTLVSVLRCDSIFSV